MKIQNHFDLLGKRVRDAVTGYEGIVTTISFDLYGCIQAIITPPADKKDGIKVGDWFDVTRITVLDHIPVMPLPNFVAGYTAEGKKGAARKPLP